MVVAERSKQAFISIDAYIFRFRNNLHEIGIDTAYVHIFRMTT